MLSSKISKTLFFSLLVFLLVVLAIFAFFTGYRYITSQDKRLEDLQKIYEAKGGKLFDENDAEVIEVHIPRSADSDKIATILAEQGIIKNKFLYKIMSKFNGFDGNYQAGTHILKKAMNYDEIMFVLTRQPKPLTITFREGMTYQEMKKLMLEKGMRFDEKILDALVRSPNQFLDYDFVRKLAVKPNRKWILQGYLWPDTYQFDPNTSEENILRVFLNNTDAKVKDAKYVERAKYMDMSLDDVITLASIVQSEGTIADMNKIGRVFLNRQREGMALESCASINYLRIENNEEPQLWILNSDLERFKDNLYNTYAFAGLPPGPINSPGIAAVEAVLWPATERTWSGANSYYYFCAKGDGTNAFASTLEAHNENVAYYSSLKRD